MPVKLRESASRFAAELKGALGERVGGVVLFGSVARGEGIEGVSDVNLLVLVEPIDASSLRAASPLARRWAKAGNTPPLLFATREVPRAVDAFAIEFSDMLDAREVLLGTDPLAGAVIDPSALRLQAENEIRGKIVQLREGLLLAAEAPEQVGALLTTALPSFTTYQRAALRLAGRAVPGSTPEVITAAAALVGGAPDAFQAVWDARTQKRKLKVAIEEATAQGYYELAERTADYIDRLTEKAQ